MKKFLPFSRRQPSLDRYTVNRSGRAGSDRFNGKSMRRTSAASLNTRSIQVVRGAYNIDLNKVDSSFTKLHRACLLNDDAQVKKHIHKVDNNLHDSSHRYPIHLATVNGNFEIVKLLIENQADPNVKDNEENTPLIKSIECGHEHLVKYLLGNGADPNLSDSHNNTALHWAIMTESIIAIDALMTSKKCDFSLRNNKDETCLHLAVRSPLINTLTFESMIIGGSDLEAKDQLGLTALDIAQACNNKIATLAFDRCLSGSQIANTKTSPCNQSDTNDKHTNSKKMSDEYKLKYMAKNKENLEYERRLIKLTAQIDRLKFDMVYMKEQNEKLENDNDKLYTENSKLKIENSDLSEELRKFKEVGARPESEASGRDKGEDLDRVDSVECRSHGEFLVARAFMQEEINKLKYGLSTM